MRLEAMLHQLRTVAGHIFAFADPYSSLTLPTRQWSLKLKNDAVWPAGREGSLRAIDRKIRLSIDNSFDR